jgi:hypothetical protein
VTQTTTHSSQHPKKILTAKILILIISVIS